jgi:hypothetical protein
VKSVAFSDRLTSKNSRQDDIPVLAGKEHIFLAVNENKKIAAGRTAFALLGGGIGGAIGASVLKPCQYQFYLTPETDHDYEVSVSDGTIKNCVVTILDTTTNQVVPISSPAECSENNE